MRPRSGEIRAAMADRSAGLPVSIGFVGGTTSSRRCSSVGAGGPVSASGGMRRTRMLLSELGRAAAAREEQQSDRSWSTRAGCIREGTTAMSGPTDVSAPDDRAVAGCRHDSRRAMRWATSVEKRTRRTGIQCVK